MLKNALLLVQLRWIAIIFQLSTLCGAITFHLPVNISLFLFSITIQIATNLFTYFSLNKNWKESEWYILIQLCLDLIFLNVFMITTGGLSNPFSGLFLIQAVLASMFLKGPKLLLMIAATAISYSLLLLGFNPSCHEHDLWMRFHIEGMVINHILTTLIIGYFVYKIMQNLKEKEKQLLAQQSLAGIGATAAQIAHKLGTPLNKMAFIIPDMTSDTLITDQKNLIKQIQTCKQSLTLFFEQLQRLEKPQTNSLLDQQFSDFQQRMKQRFQHATLIINTEQEIAITSTRAELICLILEIIIENAIESSAKTIQIQTTLTKSTLAILIENDGAPLSKTLSDLMVLGTTEKGPHHTGIGLFLAKLMLENLGAQVKQIEINPVKFEIKIPMDY